MQPPKTVGINHNAFVMWDPAATVKFYRDILGFPLVHAITAKGWGQDDHADFAHVFFDIGGGNYAAFFYYFDVEARDQRSKDYVGNGRHMALHCDTEEGLSAWHAHLKAHGVNVSPPIRHELIESIYFTDPNGYPLEITRPLRPMAAIDAADAELTVAALLETVATGNPSSADMWRRKGRMVAAALGQAA
ncbi:VOC family protein [Sphingomonas sp. SRS2]|uniref:VOC family protein n=1 Tax=Sphingomonas sp. SRS2 TaxID=133190 RepID=UPI000A53FD2B|nr:VOC family protein [Sphingomonas sp. SRS2]